MKNYYELLGISQTATEQEIKTAYRKLSQKFHPDKNEGDKFFEEMFKKIQEAYEVLGNAAQRKNYDLQLAKNTNKQQTTAKNNFVPVIEIFIVNPPQVYSGEVITVSWKAFNADKITINLIGEVEAQGKTTIRLNNLNANEFAEIKITATNTYINKATEKIIQVANKTYFEIKEKVKREMEEKEKRKLDNKEIKQQGLKVAEKEEQFETIDSLNLIIKCFVSLFIFITIMSFLIQYGLSTNYIILIAVLLIFFMSIAIIKTDKNK